MSLRRAAVAGVIGAVLTAVVDPFLLPLAAVTAGVLVAVVLTRRFEIQRHFDAVGASFALCLGAVIPSITLIPEILAETPRLALVVFGTLSGMLVSIRLGGRVAIRFVSRRFTEVRTPSRIWDVLSTIGSVIVLIWSVIRIKERIIRTGVLGITAPLSLVLNLAGRMIDLPWFLDPGIDLLAIIYIGCVVVGFHTLASWYSVLTLKDDPLVQGASSTTREAAVSAGSKTKETAATAKSTTKDVTWSAKEGMQSMVDGIRGSTQDSTASGDSNGTINRGDGATETIQSPENRNVFGAGIMTRILGIDRTDMKSSNEKNK